MKRRHRSSLLAFSLLVIALIVTACGGGGGPKTPGGPDNGNGGNGGDNGGPPTVEHEDTGSITATLDGAERAWHTVKGNFDDGVYFNTAQWYVHEETGHYRVRLQGRKTKNFYDMDETIEVIFALKVADDGDLQLVPPVADGPPEVGYFPVGPTLDDAFYFSDGELHIAEAEQVGDDTLRLRGSFFGTLTKQSGAAGSETKEILDGQFDIREATLQPLDTLGWVDDDYGKIPNPLASCILTDPCEIETLDQLQAIGQYAENLRHNYKLIADIDAEETATWVHEEGTKGFVPIGDSLDTKFKGSFDGNNKTISNLYIDRTDHADDAIAVSGLFGVIDDDGWVHDVTLENVDVAGMNRVAGLSGLNRGRVDDVIVSGTVVGVGDQIAGVGGVVGENEGELVGAQADVLVTAENTGGGLVGTNNGRIENSISDGAVQGEIVGGLVGTNGTGKRATITNSSSSAAVVGAGFGQAGGLVGRNVGNVNFANKIIGSHSTGSVSGAYQTGGLVGVNDEGAVIEQSYSESDVESDGIHDASHGTGGFVGVNYGTIEDARSSGNVTGTVGSVGGLVGYNAPAGTITHAASTGRVEGGSGPSGNTPHVAGGLVGGNAGTVRESYSHQTQVLGGGYVGGLVGRIFVDGAVKDSYSMSAVAGLPESGASVGGLVGFLQRGEVSTSFSTGLVADTGRQRGGLIGADGGPIQAKVIASYWDTETSGQNTSAGDGAEGRTTADLGDESTYAAQWDFGGVWEMHATDGYPDLTLNSRD